MAPKLFTQKALDNGAFFDMIAVSERKTTTRSKSVVSTMGSNCTSPNTPKIASMNQREELASPPSPVNNSGAVDEASSPEILTEVAEVTEVNEVTEVTKVTEVTEQDLVVKESVA